ncbi:MAG: cytochrome c biogenesis protein CcsA [Bdellovibrionota bacterium]
MNSAQIANSLGLIAYAITSILYLLSFSKKFATNKSLSVAFAAFCLSTAFETTSLLIKQNGISLIHDSGSILAEVVGWLTIIAFFRYNMKTLGAFIAPLATLMLLIQFYASSPAPGTVDVSGYPRAFLSAHVLLAILGEAAAVAACGISGVYLRQRRLLKQKLMDSLNLETPALDGLERLLMISLWTGFIFITFSLLSGAFYSHLWGHSPFSQGVKTLWAIFVWSWYLIALLSRLVFNVPITRIAKMSFIGFLLLATTFFGIFTIPSKLGGM